MNTTSAPARRAVKKQSNTLTTSHTPAASSEVVEKNFDALSGQGPIVEHLTIPGFLRLIDHRWALGDVRRFGNEMHHMAEALSLAYLTTTDAALGVLRMYPEPLCRRVYDNLAPQFGWPVIVDVDTPQLEEQKKRRDAIKAHERTLKQLRDAVADTDNVEESESLNATVKLYEAKLAKLRGCLDETVTSA